MSSSHFEYGYYRFALCFPKHLSVWDNTDSQHLSYPTGTSLSLSWLWKGMISVKLLAWLCYLKPLAVVRVTLSGKMWGLCSLKLKDPLLLRSLGKWSWTAGSELLSGHGQASGGVTLPLNCTTTALQSQHGLSNEKDKNLEGSQRHLVNKEKIHPNTTFTNVISVLKFKS